ncbi:MAG: 6-carboxytetrahydropterin synthase [Gemmatimonadota bacterium]|jgi:6-pyruvoyltetrahydropterin/6-carboxytetrahydropterin synthase
MPEASLVRTVRFSAGHHYGRPDWSDEENRRVFGSAVHPHGHNWALTVTVRGPVDPETGFVVDLGELDTLLRTEVVERFDQRDLNEEVAPVREGAMQPTTEALARWLYERLAPRIPGTARLVRVRLAESHDLAAEYRGSA